MTGSELETSGRRPGIVYSQPDPTSPPAEGRVAPKASIVIRTYNESRHLPEIFSTIKEQTLPDNGRIEVILVDSGSTDPTLEIAEAAGARILHIAKKDFSFGRSLNVGCEAALGDMIVFISGHCIPVGDRWLANLLEPFQDPNTMLSYGCQVSAETTRFSESQIFRKYFPETHPASQAPDFCNNANSAIRRSAWRRFRYDESLTGLEDIHMGRRIVESGFRVAYAPDSKVIHIHDETWAQIRHRFEREAIALRAIRPELHLHATEALRYFIAAVQNDSAEALRQRKWFREIAGIVAYRFHQYLGSWSGNHLHRKLSRQEKIRYFYPE